jgi:hypothetical protein
MATVTPYKNLEGEDMVSVVNDDGTTWSGYKFAYDAMQAASTLPSNSAPAEKPKK